MTVVDWLVFGTLQFLNILVWRILLLPGAASAKTNQGWRVPRKSQPRHLKGVHTVRTTIRERYRFKARIMSPCRPPESQHTAAWPDLSSEVANLESRVGTFRLERKKEPRTKTRRADPKRSLGSSWALRSSFSSSGEGTLMSSSSTCPSCEVLLAHESRLGANSLVVCLGTPAFWRYPKGNTIT